MYEESKAGLRTYIHALEEMLNTQQRLFLFTVYQDSDSRTTAQAYETRTNGYAVATRCATATPSFVL